MSNSYCQSFAYDTSHPGSCRLYSTTVEETFAVTDEVQIDVFTYYDSSCYGCSDKPECYCVIIDPNPPIDYDCMGDIVINLPLGPLMEYRIDVGTEAHIEICMQKCSQNMACESVAIAQVANDAHCILLTASASIVSDIGGTPWDGISLDVHRLYDKHCFLCSRDNNKSCQGVNQR